MDSIQLRAQDGVEGGDTGVVVLRDGQLRGGSSHFYWFGTYTCAEEKWKGELCTQEHTPADPQRLMAGKVGTVGFSGTYTAANAVMHITWVVLATKAGGNYGEIFERNVGKARPLKLDRSLNASWSKGGLMYAIPFK